MVVTIKAVIASFGGKLLKLSHMATSTRCEMAFNLYLPPQAFEEPQKKIPVLIYLSGLTCTADNCSEKGFFQHGASKNGIAVLYPDTSPSTIILFLTGYFFSAHCTMLESLLGIEPQSLPQGYGHEVADTFIGGLNIPGENDSWDFGTGAGFYVDATQQPFNEVYNMYTYVKEELPNVVFQEFPELDPKRVSITGHSMGGHGALMLFLRNPGKYRSVSAFAPICNPINCPWGQKAFSGYLGEKYQDLWREYDSTELVKGWKGPLNMLIDVGTGDNFYKQGQLLPKNFEQAVTEAGVEGLCMRYQPGYDHSYYTMASFSDDHVAHAARYLL